MTDVQEKLSQLKEKGWTLAAIADEFEYTPNAIEKWKAGQRQPSKADLLLLDGLLKKKRVPKQRRYLNDGDRRKAH